MTRTDTALAREVPAGPVLDLVVEILGSETPSTSSLWVDGRKGLRLTANGKECIAFHGPEPRQWRVVWGVLNPKEAVFEATVTWERIK